MNSGFNYTLKFKTFQQLLDSVAIDFRSYDLQGLIEPSELIKVVFKVTYDLGLRVYATKETTLDLEKGVVKLPDDFFTINFALLCAEKETLHPLIQGKQIMFEEYKEKDTLKWACTGNVQTCPSEDLCLPNPTVPTDPCQTGETTYTSQIRNENPDSCLCVPAPCMSGLNDNHVDQVIPIGLNTSFCPTKRRVYLSCTGKRYDVLEVRHMGTYRYKHVLPLSIDLDYSTRNNCEGCSPMFSKSPNKIQIRNGWLYSQFDDGTIYLNYQGYPESEDGELLVPDHPFLNEYYEYALKQRILENLLMNGEEITDKKLQLIENRLREARLRAQQVVNTPSFAEMANLWKMNRKAMYNKYYTFFKRIDFSTM